MSWRGYLGRWWVRVLVAVLAGLLGFLGSLALRPVRVGLGAPVSPLAGPPRPPARAQAHGPRVYVPAVYHGETRDSELGYARLGYAAGPVEVLDGVPWISYLAGPPGDTELVAMVWCLADGFEYQIPIVAEWLAWRYAMGYRGSVVLMLNEPSSMWGQCGTQTIAGELVRDRPDLVAASYAAAAGVLREADPSVRLAAGGLLYYGQPEGLAWWDAFIETLGGLGALGAVDLVHAHAYPGHSSPCEDWLGDDWPASGAGWCLDETLAALVAFRDRLDGQGLAGRPLWVTEAGCIAFTAALEPYREEGSALCRDNVLEPALAWWGRRPAGRYGTLFWYSGDWRPEFWPSSLTDEAGELSVLGEAFKLAVAEE